MQISPYHTNTRGTGSSPQLGGGGTITYLYEEKLHLYGVTVKLRRDSPLPPGSVAYMYT